MTTGEEYRKPLPRMVASERPLWEGAAAGELRLQRCSDCGHWRFPPSSLCPACLSQHFEWAAASGNGTVWSWVVMHQKYFASFEDDVPYNVALIELEEGPRLMSTVVPFDPSRMRCGAPVRVHFDKVTDDVSLPKFSLVDVTGSE